MMRGVKDIKSYDLWALEKNSTLKFHLELNSTIFRKEKMEKFYADCYNILTIRIDNIRFQIIKITDTVSFIILHLFALHTLLEGEF